MHSTWIELEKPTDVPVQTCSFFAADLQGFQIQVLLLDSSGIYIAEHSEHKLNPMPVYYLLREVLAIWSRLEEKTGEVSGSFLVYGENLAHFLNEDKIRWLTLRQLFLLFWKCIQVEKGEVWVCLLELCVEPAVKADEELFNLLQSQIDSESRWCKNP